MAMRVLHVGGEAGPYFKTGGLGEVLGALPRHQRAEGIDARVVMPLYGAVDRAGLRLDRPLPLSMAGRPVEVRLWRSEDGHALFVDAPGLLDRPEAYGGYADNPLRFAVFAKAVSALVDEVDVFHLHDWHAGLTPVYLRGARPVVMTVHNLAYQGRCDLGWAEALEVPPHLRTFEVAEWHGLLNPLKVGLALADRLTTVSPRYAQEIQSEPGGHGLSGVFQHRRAVLSGVLNGIDEVAWDPATDVALAAPFGVDALEGKAVCKAALRAELGLEAGPLFGVVSRAAPQKGLDLLIEAAEGAIAGGARLAILSDGDGDLVRGLGELARRHPGRVAFASAFDGALARRIYAGSDFTLVPSRFEPCGLTQMYAMRYGSVPVVRETGGLADTVRDGETGLSFFTPSAEELGRAMARALALYDSPAYGAMRRAGMRVDWSWARTAHAYDALYEALTGGAK